MKNLKNFMSGKILQIKYMNQEKLNLIEISNLKLDKILHLEVIKYLKCKQLKKA